VRHLKPIPETTAPVNPYMAAQQAYDELHEALAAHGVCVELCALAPDVTLADEPAVNLGRVSALGAARLAKALRDGWTLPARYPTPRACLAARHQPRNVPPDPAVTPHAT